MKSVSRTMKQSKNTIKTEKAAKVSAKAMFKATAAAIKSITAVIIAGGWVAVVIIILVAVINGILCSCYGIFFSGGDAGTGMTIRTAVARINVEYSQRIEMIKADNPHDQVKITDSRAGWPDILSVYAVKRLSCRR